MTVEWGSAAGGSSRSRLAAGRAVTVKSESAASMAAVCLGGSTVPATVMIVVEYRLVYQLMVDRRQQRPGSRWTSCEGCQGASSKRANRDWLVGIRVCRTSQVICPSAIIYLTKLYKKLLAILLYTYGAVER